MYYCELPQQYSAFNIRLLISYDRDIYANNSKVERKIENKTKIINKYKIQFCFVEQDNKYSHFSPDNSRAPIETLISS